MSSKIKVIIPVPGHTGVYGRIWNTVIDERRISWSNVCRSCRHDIMLTPDDYKRIISKPTGRNKRVYYHGEACHICNKICGNSLLRDSMPIIEVKI
jgi:NAD-dependent dihydropyrimidine dehydrogenase PreA subunit